MKLQPKVYLNKKWKFKLIGKFLRKKMYKRSPPLYFPPLASLLYFLSLFCFVYLYMRKPYFITMGLMKGVEGGGKD